MLPTSWLIAFAIGYACGGPNHYLDSGAIILMAILFGDWYEPALPKLKAWFPEWFKNG